MRELAFHGGLFEPTVDGRAKSSLRRYQKDAHDFTVGEVVKGIFGERINILLRITHDTEVKSFFELADEEAQENGYESAAAVFAAAMETCRSDSLSDADMIAVIRYEVLRVEDEPVVSFLKQS